MIYFFDNELNMVKVATSKNVISAVHEHELNGLILGTVETDLRYTEAFINDVDYFGYYYKDNYYLHKIKRVEHEHENELVRITGRHIFFEDMLYGDYIRDVRPVNRDALYILNQTISANTRWQTVMTDTSKLHSETYYWVPPMEVLNDLTENVGIEYEPRILFDGQKINGFQLHVANRIGEDTPIRVPFGSRVINLKYEVDYSEIVTALYGHGKGEEVGDGYGRRINFRDVDFSRNGVVSRPGSLFMENPNVTAQYGKDDGSPKFGRIIFEDIESTSELANATYEAYLEQSRPKMLFEASVVDLGDVGMGDGVLIIRREYDVYFNARIHKLMVDLLDAENADVELGDYAHFKESKVQRKTRESNNQYRRETSSRIQQLKEQFNDRFDGEVNQMREDYEQALIDAHAEIQAAEERMTERINSEREDLDMKIDGEIQEAKEYAEHRAQEHAEIVQGNLDAVTGSHQSMLDDLEHSVLSIDDFLGSARDITLDQRFLDISQDFEQRIRNSTRSASNILRASRFDESGMYQLYGGARLMTTENTYFVRLGESSSFNVPAVRIEEEIHLKAGVEYYLYLDYRTTEVPELDGFIFYHNDGSTEWLRNRGLYIGALNQTGEWEKAVMTLVPTQDMSGKLAMGTDFSAGNTTRGIVDIRLPYLTTSAHDQWLPHPRDENQNIEEISRRITLLEDGYQEMIVRSDWDAEMGSLTQLVRDYETTVEGVQDRIIEIEDMELITRGREVLDTVDGFERKVWLGDIDHPNIIPFSDVHKPENYEEWSGWKTSLLGSFINYLIVRHRDTESSIGMQTPIIGTHLVAGETYTAQWQVGILHEYTDLMSADFAYLYMMNTPNGNVWLPGTPQRRLISSTSTQNLYEYTYTFTMPEVTDDSRFLIGTTVTPGSDVAYRFRYPKLELGDRATPYRNAFSMFNQRADSIALQVDDQESRISQFTVDLDGISGVVADIEGDMVKQSSLDITPDYAQIGSMRIDGDTVGSMLRFSPEGIDAVAEAMRLSGDLYVDGDITALAIDAIEGNFARLWAAEFEAITITGQHIDGNTITGRNLRVDSAMVNKLIANDALIESIGGVSLEYIYADIRKVDSEIMDTNILKADWIQGGNALLDKVFANTAMFERMMAKSGFVSTMSAITLDLHELTIWRPDGVAFVQNGIARFGTPVPIVQYMTDNVETNGRTYWTNLRTPQTVGIAYGEHAGRWYNLAVGMGLRWDSDYATQYCKVRIEPADAHTASVANATEVEVTARRDEGLQWQSINVPLLRPTYSSLAFYIQLYRRGDNVYAPVEMRYGRSWVSG